MKIVVVGAGNLGLCLTGYLAHNTKNEIWLYTKKNILDAGKLKIVEVEEEKEYDVDNFNVSFDKKAVFKKADIILCTYPAFLRPTFSIEIENVIENQTKLVFIPGYGGVEYCCKNLIDKGITIYGLQRVPFISRYELTSIGYVAKILSKKNLLKLASFPDSFDLLSFFEENFKIKTEKLNSFLSITLCNSNPILHLCGVYNAFKDYRPGEDYKEQLYMYSLWNDETSKLLIRYDKELFKIYKTLSPKDAKEYVSLTKYYEAPTPKLMTKKLKSIKSFGEVKIPLKKEKDMYVPELESRIFIEDFPFGLCIYKELANMLNLKVPTMELLLNFYEKISGICYYDVDGNPTSSILKTGSPKVYGLNSKEKLLNYYGKSVKK